MPGDVLRRGIEDLVGGCGLDFRIFLVPYDGSADLCIGFRIALPASIVALPSTKTAEWGQGAR